MDIWLVRIGAVATVLQTIIVVLGYFDIAPFGLGAPWVWRFLFVSVTIFTWVVLCWIVQRQKKSKKEVLVKDEEIARLNRLLKEKEIQSQSEKKGLTLANSSPPLSMNEIIHPPDGGVLWRWNQKSGAGGPFCPHHKSRLFYRDHYRGEDKIEDFDESFLSSSGWFVCPLDPAEEFIFVKLGPITVGHLRAQAAERLRVKLESELVSPS